MRLWDVFAVQYEKDGVSLLGGPPQVVQAKPHLQLEACRLGPEDRRPKSMRAATSLIIRCVNQLKSKQNH